MSATTGDAALAREEHVGGPRILRGPDAPYLLREEQLADLFEASLRRAPDAPCIVTRDIRLSYAEVDRRAAAIARGLHARDVRPGAAVGLWAPRGPDLVIALLAIARTGAAWLPFDAEAPVERVATCLRDAGARMLLTTTDFAQNAHALDSLVLVDRDIALETNNPLPGARVFGARPDHPAFIIYTSGSTGTPKGVAIDNRNICHYLRAANEIYGVTRDDVVYQGASAAFDMSVEEIWLAFLAGASLFVATPDIVAETDRLPETLDAAGVTVLDTVPTLLNALPADAARLRLIILGGEAATPAIAARWARPGRRIFNTYGPTETTVVATIAELRDGEAITIGRPIANYSCYVVDESLSLLPSGVEGELLIGGPGVAAGYLDRAELTREKFIANPFASNGRDPLLYRTGDAVTIDARGDLVFRGRIDDQIKLRGFRVELGEIEATLCAQPGVREAAVVLRPDAGIDALAAFLVVADKPPDAHALRAALRETLPPYMVPARFEFIERLPRLPSKKIDRKALIALPLAQPTLTEAQEPPRSDTEALLLAAAQRVLPPGPIPFDADFFTDLGGHSLLAARFVSILRDTPRCAAVTLHDLYALRSLRALAAHLDGAAAAPPQPCDLSFPSPPLARRIACGAAQALALPLLFAVAAAPWLAAFLAYDRTRDAGAVTQFFAILAASAVVHLTTPVMSVAGKWLAIGRTRPGRYELWGVYYFRWWLAQRFTALTQTSLLAQSPLLPTFLRALGAKIGADISIGDLHVGAVDLISIADGAALGSKLTLANARVEAGNLIIGAVEIGANALIGTGCVIEDNVVIGAGATLEDLTAVGSGARIGAHEKWEGAPARRMGRAEAPPPEPPQDATQRCKAATRAHALLWAIVPPLGMTTLLPALWIVEASSARLPYPLAIWLGACALVCANIAWLAAFRFVALPRLQAGRHSIYSGLYLRLWTVALAVESALPVVSALFSTLYMRGWCRLMGARIGAGAELSTNLAGRYDLLDAGEDSFVADEASIGDPRIQGGWITLATVELGARAFIGNDAVVPAGARLPPDTLIGAKSRPPAQERLDASAAWFGSPPIALPAREAHTPDAAWTYRPPSTRKALRLAYEAISVTLPAAVLLVAGDAAARVGGMRPPASLLVAALFFPACAGVGALVAKWAAMGRHVPQARPMWSFWAMRTESSVVLYRGLARRLLLDHLRGAPFLPWALRLFGAKIGSGVFLDTTQMTEFDCVRIGDDCALNAQAALQTHLYEDRVLKVGRVTLGRGVTLGAGASALYDAHVGNFARLGPLTVVMKGEAIPAQSVWTGAPAARVR